MVFYNLAIISGTGVLLILYGLILLTRKKFMVRREYDGVFVFFIATLHPTISLIEMGYGLQVLFICILPVTVIIILLARGRFTITNVNEQMVSSILTDILIEKNISYEKEKNSVVLKDYDNKRITYPQTLNSVELNLKDIRNLSIYEDVKIELRSRIKEVKSTVFPSTGVFFLGLGIIIMVVLQYLLTKS